MTVHEMRVEMRAVLNAACSRIGLDSTGAEDVHIGENGIFRLRGGVVARIGRPGQQAAARREVAVARWLEDSDVPAVRLAHEVDQPVQVSKRAVTFWRALPPHRPGTPAQVAAALRRLHDLAPPQGVDLGVIDPFVRLDARIDSAHTLDERDRTWMRGHLDELRHRWSALPTGLPWCVVHGDAWVGNVVCAEDGTVILLDLERTAIGPPEWDTVHTAIKHTSFGWITAEDLAEFCTVYGHDVTEWAGFPLLRDIREFRMTCMAAEHAAAHDIGHEQAAHRLACLREKNGPRPWPGWTALP